MYLPYDTVFILPRPYNDIDKNIIITPVLQSRNISPGVKKKIYNFIL